MNAELWAGQIVGHRFRCAVLHSTCGWGQLVQVGAIQSPASSSAGVMGVLPVDRLNVRSRAR